jgi:mitogen-activated protein kinase 1/3
MEAIDFLSKTLVSSELHDLSITISVSPLQTFDPKKQMSVDEALEHAYISPYVCCLLTLLAGIISLRLPQHDLEDGPVVTPPSASYFQFDCKPAAITDEQRAQKLLQ